MSDILEVIEIETAPNPTAAVIWLHGLGADGNDFAPIVPELRLSGALAIRFVFPHAPMMAVTINNGHVMRAWYDVSFGDLEGNTRRADETGVRASQARVGELIEREISRGIEPRRIVLAGFSQGGAVALWTARRSTMIMPRSNDQLLMPVNPLFVWTTLAVAFLLNIVPLGRMAAMPDFLALVLVFWNVHQSRRIGVGVAFFFGLLMDVHSGAVLGQHALAYTLLSFFAVTIHRRLLWFTVPSQAVQILPLFLAAQAVSLVVHLIAGGMFPGWELILAPVFQALLWPVATWLLLAPQRRAPDPDENRPL